VNLMSTWVIVAIVVVVLGLVVLAVASRARKRRKTGGTLGLPPIGTLSGGNASQPDAQPENEPRRASVGDPSLRSR
jgi:uncharacterized membrane protein